MDYLLGEPILTVFILILVLIFIPVAYVRYSYGYWRRKKIPYIEPKFPFGSGTSLFPKGVAIGAVSAKFYEEFKKKENVVGGVYMGVDPKLVLISPDLIRDVLITDFKYFTDRGMYKCKSDPISVHIASQSGKDWRNARMKLSGVFSLIKMKQMFETMLDSSRGLEMALDELTPQKDDVDILEVAGRFTIDVLGSCLLGINCNSFKYPNAEFRQIYQKFSTEFNFFDKLNIFMCIYFPKLSEKLGLRIVQKNVSSFFFQSIRNTVNYREENNIRKNDLLQLLIDLKNSEVHLSMDELVAHVFAFFIAGVDTSSTAIALTLFEISKTEEVQEKVREEIREVLKKYDNKLTYDALSQMRCLDQAIDETLRIWPTVSTLTRVCVKDYKFNGTDMTVEKGMHVLISVRGIHHDPECWPDPTRWDPDRFSEENKRSHKPFTYLPFGEGPRNCIGLRFGLQQTKIALVTVLNKYRVSLSPKTITPLGVNMETFTLHTLNTVYLHFEKI